MYLDNTRRTDFNGLSRLVLVDIAAYPWWTTYYDQEEFLELILRLDSIWAKWYGEKRAKENPPKKTRK